MQENKLITAIDSLHSIGEITALKALRDNIQKALDYANNVLNKNEEYHPETIKDTVGYVESKINEKEKIDNKRYKNYKSGWNNIDKYQFVLKTENRFLHFREAARIIIKLDGKGDENSLTSVLTNGARRLKKSGVIIRKQHGNSNTSSFWGSPKWLNKDGSIKTEHEYDVKILEKNEKAENDRSLFDI